MASELSIGTLTVSFTKSGSSSFTVTPAALSITITGDAWMDNTQTVGTSEEAILLGDVATGGYWFVQNLDATNFVELRSGTGATDFIKLKAGEWAIFRTSGDATAPYAIADTSPCQVRFLRLEN